MEHAMAYGCLFALCRQYRTQVSSEKTSGSAKDRLAWTAEVTAAATRLSYIVDPHPAAFVTGSN
jgi:hypothetical protein